MRLTEGGLSNHGELDIGFWKCCQLNDSISDWNMETWGSRTRMWRYNYDGIKGNNKWAVVGGHE